MPRVYASNNDPIDFCAGCFPTEAVAIHVFGNHGDGPDGRGNCFEYDASHPGYDGEDYKCANCNKPLTEADDYKEQA